jgi:hypothetical protein
MSRNPAPHPAGQAPFGDRNVGDGPKADVYVKSSSAHPPVPGRTRNPEVGPCDPTSMPARGESNAPSSTPELQRGVDLGTPTGTSGGPSAAHGTLSYQERQRRARRGR